MRTIQRQPGIIPKLSRKMNARRFIFFDTETTTAFENAYGKRLNFRLGYAVYIRFDDEFNIVERDDREINKTLDFVAFLSEHIAGQAHLYIIAHNLAFDLQILNLPYALSVSGYTSDLPILAWGACMWTVHYKGKTASFFDSQNIFPGSLQSLGKDVGLRKTAIKFGVAKNAELLAYCKNDCEILVLAFQKYLKWLSDNNLGYFAQTISWQARNAYRTRFMTEDIHTHVDYVVLNYERQAYHGARTECFFIGKAPGQNYYLLDVNSLYAHVMAENEYPVEYVDCIVRPNLKQLEELMEEYYVIAECQLDTTLPAFPRRTATKLVFPIGNYRTWLHHCELQYALRDGVGIQTGIALLYRRANIFEGYTGFFAGLRESAIRTHRKTEERLAKLFLVTFYGTWGARNSITFDQGETTDPGIRYIPCKDTEHNMHWDEWHWYGKIYQTYKSGEKPYAMPSIAGAITAYGRMYLWELINEAGRSNVYYVDTDSLVVNEAGFKALQHRVNPTKLGFLKLVNASGVLDIHTNKDFRIGSDIRRKGIKVTSANTDYSAVSTEQFRGLMYRMKSGDISGVIVENRIKRRISTYDKGRILPGGTVEPWRLPDDKNEAVFGPI